MEHNAWIIFAMMAEKTAKNIEPRLKRLTYRQIAEGLIPASFPRIIPFKFVLADNAQLAKFIHWRIARARKIQCGKV